MQPEANNEFTFVHYTNKPRSTKKPAERAEKTTRHRPWARWLLTTDLERPKSIPRLDFAPVRRMQQLSNFIEEDFPTATARSASATEGAFLTLAPEMDTNFVAIGSALDAFYFARSAVKQQDERMLRQAHKSYGTALAALSRTVANPHQAGVPPRVLLFSVIIINLFERSMGLPDRWGSWMAHHRGIRALVSNGRKVLYLNRPGDRQLFCYLQFVSLVVGVALRKPAPYAWLTSAEYVEYCDDCPPMMTLLLLTKGIPSLLGRVDAFFANAATNLSELRSIHDSIQSLVQCLQDWYDKVSVFKGQQPRISARDFSGETNAWFRTLDSSGLFGPCYSFDRDMTVEEYTTYTLACLTLACTTLRLVHFRPAFDFSSSTRPTARKDDAVRMAYAHASNLCRSVHTYCDSTSIAQFSFAESLVALAGNFFTETQAVEEAEWCGMAQSAMQRQQKGFPPAQPPGMSGLEGLVEGLASVGRFRDKALGLCIDT